MIGKEVGRDVDVIKVNSEKLECLAKGAVPVKRCKIKERFANVRHNAVIVNHQRNGKRCLFVKHGNTNGLRAILVASRQLGKIARQHNNGVHYKRK